MAIKCENLMQNDFFKFQKRHEQKLIETKSRFHYRNKMFKTKQNNRKKKGYLEETIKIETQKQETIALIIMN